MKLKNGLLVAVMVLMSGVVLAASPGHGGGHNHASCGNGLWSKVNRSEIGAWSVNGALFAISGLIVADLYNESKHGIKKLFSGFRKKDGAAADSDVVVLLSTLSPEALEQGKKKLEDLKKDPSLLAQARTHGEGILAKLRGPVVVAKPVGAGPKVGCC